MKIAHLCLSCFYIDNFTYQENELVRRNVADGHDVVVIASTETYGPDRQLAYVEPGTYLGGEGARVVRLPYRRGLPQRAMRKLRMHPGLAALLEREQPDVILFHGLCGWELLTAARHARRHPRVKLFADSHEDHYNSARSFGSRLLHRAFYRRVLARARREIDRILCISVETMDFVEAVYDVPREELEFFPLGGNVFDDAEYALRRARGRQRAGVADGEVMFLQSGKMGRAKRVVEALEAFGGTRAPHLRYVLAGALHDDIEPAVRAAMASDPRIAFLGWCDAEAMMDLLCAADLYVQPGTQSATMQMSLCARCPVVLEDVPSHRPFLDGNGWLLDSPSQLPGVFAQIEADPALLVAMSARSHALAGRLLDYRLLARRITG